MVKQLLDESFLVENILWEQLIGLRILAPSQRTLQIFQCFMVSLLKNVHVQLRSGDAQCKKGSDSDHICLCGCGLWNVDYCSFFCTVDML